MRCRIQRDKLFGEAEIKESAYDGILKRFLFKASPFSFFEAEQQLSTFDNRRLIASTSRAAARTLGLHPSSTSVNKPTSMRASSSFLTGHNTGDQKKY